MEFFHFLNLQYWYCIIYSLFGGRCTYLEELREAQEESTGPGFFVQLWDFLVSVWSTFWDSAAGIIAWVWSAYSAVAYTLSAFLFLLILFALGGLVIIRMREMYVYGTVQPKDDSDNPRNGRWKELLEDAMSTDPKRWRRAIVEADGMLGELLDGLGYKGINTAERMKGLPEDAFVTVPVSWEAHRIRNFVTNGSSDFILTQREAFRTMKLYEQVFEEFDFI